MKLLAPLSVKSGTVWLRKVMALKSLREVRKRLRMVHGNVCVCVCAGYPHDKSLILPSQM